jgi:hypothetical protein
MASEVSMDMRYCRTNPMHYECECTLLLFCWACKLPALHAAKRRTAMGGQNAGFYIAAVARV